MPTLFEAVALPLAKQGYSGDVPPPRSRKSYPPWKHLLLATAHPELLCRLPARSRLSLRLQMSDQAKVMARQLNQKKHRTFGPIF
jgi:hypothetical protein